MSKEPNQIAHFLNLCDRVEVLSNIVHDQDRELDLSKFDGLLEPFYPCLNSFFKDIKHEENVVGIDASFQEDKASFIAKYADKTTKTFTYNEPSDIVLC